LRLFSFGGYGLALAALALVLFSAYDSYPTKTKAPSVPDIEPPNPGDSHGMLCPGPLEASVAAASVLVVAMLALLLLVHRRWWTPSVGAGLACCQDVGVRRRMAPPSAATLAETGISPSSVQASLPPAPLLLAANSDLGKREQVWPVTNPGAASSRRRPDCVANTVMSARRGLSSKSDKETNR